MRKEIDLIQTTPVEEAIVWVRDNTVAMLQTVLTWQQDIETALTQAGINVKISDEGTMPLMNSCIVSLTFIAIGKRRRS